MGALLSFDSPLFRLINKLLNLLWLSILWAVCCIPIITIGASTTALYSVTLKYTKNEEGYITSSFFTAFRQNFKQASIIWWLLLLAGLALSMDVIIYSRSNTVGLMSILLMTFFFSLLLAFVLMHLYIYPLLAKFNNTIRRTLINSLVMALLHWPSSISMFTISIVILIIGIYAFPPILFFAPGLIAYINSRFLLRIFDRYQEAA